MSDYTNRICVVLVVWSLTGIADGFLPNYLYRCGDEVKPEKVDHTHESMTRLTLETVIADLIANNSESKILWRTREEALQSILEGSREMDRVGHDKAVNHFNAEQLIQGNEKLIEWRRQINDLVSRSIESETAHKDYPVIRRLIGQSLHLIQDFYSNSDWTEMKGEGKLLCEHLGVENKKFKKIVDQRRKLGTCVDQNQVADGIGGIYGNIVHNSNWITSGYRSHQDISKPNVEDVSGGSDTGKCSHGGQYDSSAQSQTQKPRGGINSESYDYRLSPKFSYHERSSQLAIKASKAFFSSSSGLTADIPEETLLNILGLESRTQNLLVITKPVKQRLTRRELSTLRDRLPSSNQEVSVNQYSVDGYFNLLGMISKVPDHSQIVLLTAYGHTMEGTWDEDILKAVLAWRHIRLLVFVRRTGNEQSSDPFIAAVQRLCLSSKGSLYFYKEVGEITDVIEATRSELHQISYKVPDTGNVTVVVPPSESPTAIVINCETVEWEEPNILPTFTDSIRVVNTPYIHVYNIISNTTQLVTVELSAQQAAHCLVSAYSQQQVLEVYTVSEGERGQLYRRPMRVSGKSRIAVEVTTQFDDVIAPDRVDVNGYLDSMLVCPTNKARNELRQTYTTNIIPSLPQADERIYIDFIFENTTITIIEYIDEQPIEIRAMSIIPENSTSIDMLIINTRIDVTKFSFKLLDVDAELANISSTDHSAENFTVTITSENFNLIQNPIIFELDGLDGRGSEFHAVQLFYRVTADEVRTTTEPSTTTFSTTTTDITTSTASTISIVISNTNESLVDDPTNSTQPTTRLSRIGSETASNDRLLQLFAISLVITFVTLVIATGLFATVLKICYYLRKKHKFAKEDIKSSYTSLNMNDIVTRRSKDYRSVPTEELRRSVRSYTSGPTEEQPNYAPVTSL